MKKVKLLSAAVVALFLASCNNSKFEGYTQTESGLYYKFFNQDENGKKVQLGDGIIIRYVITKESNDSVIIDSKKVSQDGTGDIQFGLSKSSFKGSFEDGMLMMCKGDSASFIVSADSFFLKTNQATELPKGFKPGEYLKAVIKIKDVRTKAELAANEQKQMEEVKQMQSKEQPAIDKYLADNNITVKPTASGLYYIETKKGTGGSPKSTDIITFHYTGRFLDGRPFDSSIERGTPVEYPLNQLIPGWIEGIQLMKKGGKANMVIPSAIGYGPQGNQGIPPYSPLTFEVELIDFKPAPAQPQGAMPQPGQ